jgi:cell wall-associated NlpC family hydrolase
MWAFLKRGVQAVAAGGAQRSLGLQSPHLPSALVRVGRFLYGVTGIWIGVSWYVGYVNERVPTGSGPSLVLPGQPVTNTVDRTAPTPAAFNGGSGSGTNNPAQTGAKGGSARLTVARLALAQVNKSGFEYSETRPIPNSLNTRPFKSDCSGFCIDLYKAIGAADPSGNGYNGNGDTSDMQQHGTSVGFGNTGDLAFWANPDHVAIVVGTGTNPAVVGFGAPPSPIKNTLLNESQYHQRFVGFRSYL